MSPARLAVTVAAALLGGCGAAPRPTRPATLPAAAVPYLPSSLKPLTAAGLAREAGVPALKGQLGQWGYLGGAQRYFQGESRRLQLVDSRTLAFRRADGADAYVTFVRAHLSVYLGSFPRVKALSSRGRRGIIAIAQACQCHLANPAYLGVVVRGGNVTWLEINGPGATPRGLAALIDRAP